MRSRKALVNSELTKEIRTPGIFHDHFILEQTDFGFLAYDIFEQKFIVPNDLEQVWEKWETRDATYLPLSSLPWRSLPFPTEYQSEAALYQELREFIYSHVDFAQTIEYDVAAAWVMHTWRIENFNVTPYLFLYGPPASGKTWAMEVLSAVSHRPMLMMVSPASLYRITQNWHPTMFLDETQLYVQGNEKQDVLNYLNAGYRRGQKVVRTEANALTGVFEPVLFEVFGPKCLAVTRDLLQALKSRCFVFTMSRATRKVDTWLDKQEVDSLRAKLLTYRLNSLTCNPGLISARSFTLESVLDGRLKELFFSLYTVAPEATKVLFMDYAIQLEKKRMDEEALSLENLVFNALTSSHENRLLIPLKDVVKTINCNLPETEELKSRTVGSVVTRLGFNKIRRRNGVHVVWDKELFQRLSKRYKVIEMEMKEDEQTLVKDHW